MQLCGHEVGTDRKIFLIAGPCVIESEALCLKVAETLRGLADELDMLVIFKSSFDKANRTSGASFRGPGVDGGLRILEKVRAETGLPILTDVHAPEQVAPAAEVVDVLQTPAFLARQTDLIETAARSGKPVNFKKAQFMSPQEMQPLAEKGARGGPRGGRSGAVHGVRTRIELRLQQSRRRFPQPRDHARDWVPGGV